MPIPHIFAAQNGPIPLSWLDDDFAYVLTNSGSGGAINVVASVVALRALPKTGTPYALLASYATGGPRLDSVYGYDSTDTTSSDNGVTIIVASDGGRWKLSIDSPAIKLEQAGAKGDGTTDDTAAIVRALATGLNVIGLFGSTYKITSGLAMNTAGQTIDLGGATLKPVGTFNALTLGASVLTMRNMTIEQAGLTGLGVNAPAAQQQIVMEDVTLQNGTSGMQLIDCYTSWFTRLKINFFSVAPMVLKSTISGTATNSMWFNGCSFNGHTTTGDVIHLEGAVAIYLEDCNFQTNQFSNCNEIRITTNANAGTAHIVIDHCYFEAFGTSGNSIYIGDPASGTNQCGSIKVINNYFQTPKQPIRIGSLVANDTEILGNTFQFVTGFSGFAVITPANHVPDCHGNTGSLPDIDRSWTPVLKFGGASTGIVYGSGGQKARIQRNGTRCFGEIALNLLNKGSSLTAATIGGLPIPASSVSFTNTAQATLFSNFSGLIGPIIGNILPTASEVTLYMSGTGGVTVLNDTFFTNTSNLYLSFSMEVN